ncbi:MAG: aminotransferase class I/II-fold pyridoxal phosphate-dependent enzyme [Gammaproteobacteria bacterium]|nr:aminotransferase class I/II-fold pyridoxal phosphate-dependent enzyme [Gammaproteobacteria bacterium]NIM72883.1 aminotransferase class I/II-fold pyridoxal phosphate-dependent enzyme [Gammaproteobacteria bacterium]NIN38494.1 aminotransferase class I/II-fold pyridoxal phosphate-dependent enzyme [Gammaproteobacteria bacterium]NIO24635.1 aminotransferase class I/II-fold pyridoxal phosphate-dependent enzyme [Gammaproteobacteria bacterium]NIO65238.1 aminotransferase class I/II-fold pyridoxal phosp
MNGKQHQEAWGERTRAIHAGEAADPMTRASSPNLVMSATFVRDHVAGFSALNLDEKDGFSYARVSSPTVMQLAEKLAALERSESALCFASGMAASHALMAGRMSQGDHIIISDTNYVGTAELVRDSLPRWGIDVSAVDTSDPEMVEAAITPKTKMLWIETPANPIMRLSDIRVLADLAHRRGVEDVVVDSTFATPAATRPLELGADFVVHSLTKYIGGHGDAMGGAVLGRAADLAALNLEAMVHYGGVLSPFNAWLILRGAATFPLRMRAHEETALEVGRFLESHPAVERVFYPGLPSHPQHDLARRQMRNFSGMITFRTREDGEKVAERMTRQLEIIHYAVSLGHHRSLIYWIPTEMLMESTFRLDSDAEIRYRDFAGDGVFRFSVGLEDPEDLCTDLNRVLE